MLNTPTISFVRISFYLKVFLKLNVMIVKVDLGITHFKGIKIQGIRVEPNDCFDDKSLSDSHESFES